MEKIYEPCFNCDGTGLSDIGFGFCDICWGTGYLDETDDHEWSRIDHEEHRSGEPHNG